MSLPVLFLTHFTVSCGFFLQYQESICNLVSSDHHAVNGLEDGHRPHSAHPLCYTEFVQQHLKAELLSM